MARVRALDVNGDYSFGNGSANFLINSSAMVAQNIQTRLLLMEGEWFVDVTEGTPYSTQVLGAGAAVKPFYDLAIQARILETVGVLTIASYESTLDPVARKLNINATVSTIFGETTFAVTFK